METACTAGILACCAAIAGIALAAFGPDPWPKKLFIPEAVVAQDLEGRACDGTPTRCPNRSDQAGPPAPGPRRPG